MSQGQKKKADGTGITQRHMTDDSSVGPNKGDKFQDLASDLRFESYIRSNTTWDRIGSLCTRGKYSARDKTRSPCPGLRAVQG